MLTRCFDVDWLPSHQNQWLIQSWTRAYMQVHALQVFITCIQCTKHGNRAVECIIPK